MSVAPGGAALATKRARPRSASTSPDGVRQSGDAQFVAERCDIDAGVAQLVSMDFPAHAALRALRSVGGDVTAAIEKLLSGSTSAITSEIVVVEAEGACDAGVAALTELGFTASDAAYALRVAGGDAERAAELLFKGPLSRPTSASSRAAPRLERVALDPEDMDVDVEPLATSSPSQPASSSSRPPPAPIGLERQPPKDVEAHADAEGGNTVRKPKRARPQENGEGHGKVDGDVVGRAAAGFAFGAAAFGPLPQPAAPSRASRSDLGRQVQTMVGVSVPGVTSMKGERESKFVAGMLADIYAHGLHMHGPETSPVNSEIVPAFRYIMAEMAKLPPRSVKRVSCLTTLAHACQDCQQVQAREILRMYQDLTAQTETLEIQLKYSLVRQKEAALNLYITQHHPRCDLDHTKVPPHQQRAHLMSGYVAAIGGELGCDGVTAAQNDRFLAQVRQEMGKLHPKKVLEALKQELSVKEWLQTLLADINNQVAGADRLIARDRIFKWVQENMGQDRAHEVFYDEDRADEFVDHDPKEPTPENRYQPFLSCRVLVDILQAIGMLQAKQQAIGDQQKR